MLNFELGKGEVFISLFSIHNSPFSADCGLHGILNVELLATFYVVKIGKRRGFYFTILYSQFTIFCGLPPPGGGREVELSGIKWN